MSWLKKDLELIFAPTFNTVYIIISSVLAPLFEKY